MSQASRVVKSEADDLPVDLVELGAALETLGEADRRRVTSLYQRVVDSTKRRRRILALVQDALSQLRLDMKYLLFDLEATRRERDDLRRQIEEA
ncbi:MAG TPA: transcriptional regulator [Pirellulales bacterium]|jgi:hypothetical protein|nr:transcriptional regulator [Pirellulales bacterium]